MQEQQYEKVRAVAWSEVMPWLSLARCFRLAVSLRPLLLSAIATLMTLTGWTIFALAFSRHPEVAEQLGEFQTCPWRAVTGLVPDRPPLLAPSAPPPARPAAHAAGAKEAMPGEGVSGPAQSLFSQPPSILARRAEPVVGTWQHLGRPFAEVFQADLAVENMAFLVLCGLWALAVWAFFGACIARFAAVRLAAGERIGWSAMLRHAGVKWRAYVAAPLFPLVAVLGISVPVSVAGFLLLRLDWTVWIAGLLWPLLLLAGLLMAVLLLGLAFGWPLMWATIACEGTDSFDALSRSYNYTFQRPLHYLFYVAVAAALGALGWIVVVNFVAGAVALTYGAAAWGAGAIRVDHIVGTAPGLDPLGVGAVVIRFSVGCLKLLAVGFLSSYFWTASTAIYFLLRRNVDATEMDEVYLDEDGQQQSYGLPPIRTDAAGAPIVDDSAPAAEGD